MISIRKVVDHYYYHRNYIIILIIIIINIIITITIIIIIIIIVIVIVIISIIISFNFGFLINTLLIKQIKIWWNNYIIVIILIIIYNIFVIGLWISPPIEWSTHNPVNKGSFWLQGMCQACLLDNRYQARNILLARILVSKLLIYSPSEISIILLLC